jgi:hypothetical protein
METSGRHYTSVLFLYFEMKIHNPTITWKLVAHFLLWPSNEMTHYFYFSHYYYYHYYYYIIDISFMQGIYTYIPETNHVPREHCVATILM